MMKFKSARVHIQAIMSDGEWRTPDEIRIIIGRGSKHTIVARMADIRREGITIEKRRRYPDNCELFEYRVSNEPS